MRTRSIEVGHQQGDVRVAGMLFGHVHQDVWFVGGRRVEHEVDLDAGLVRQDGDRLWPYRAGDEVEAEHLVKRDRALEVVDADADVRDGGDHAITLAGMRVVRSARW